MFTKCFFSAPKVLFVCKMGAFFAKNVGVFFPWKGAFFKCFFFLPKSTTIPGKGYNRRSDTSGYQSSLGLGE